MKTEGLIAPLAPRTDYPMLERRNYINSAAIGLVPLPVQREALEFTEFIGTNGDKGYFESLYKLEDRPAETAAKLFGCSPDEIFLTSSISEAMNDIAWSLMPKAGQNVVCVDIDIPCTTFPWIRVSEVTGAEIRFTDCALDPASLSTEHVLRLIDDNTAVVCLSMVQWLTGHMLDIRRIAEAAHACGALLIVDGMHTVATMPINVRELGVDMMVHGSYKWLGSYSGLAAAYITPELTARVRPALVGSNTPYMPPPYNKSDPTRLLYNPGTKAFAYCSASHSAKVAYGAAANYMLDLGLEKIHAHISALVDQLITGLALLGAEMITPTDADRHAGVFMAQFPGIEIMELYKAMEAAGVQVSCRLDGLRFSPGVFNGSEDIAQALEVLEGLLKKAGYRR